MDETNLKKWGNSYVIRIPNKIIKSLNLNLNSKFIIEEKDNKIIITKLDK